VNARPNHVFLADALHLFQCFAWQVPLSHIMTSDVARVSDIGKLVCAAERNGLELRSKHTLLASYLLQEKAKGEASYWAPYLVTLPQQFKNMPIFFPPEDLAWLKGSMCIEKILERQDSLHLEYDNVCAAVPEFAKFSYDEFVWARLVVITRIFGLTIKGDKTDGLVPMADMLNHRRPRETKWTFDDSRNAFTITSLKVWY
jgi:histone-lysine N-methyltransferase SETD3